MTQHPKIHTKLKRSQVGNLPGIVFCMRFGTQEHHTEPATNEFNYRKNDEGLEDKVYSDAEIYVRQKQYELKINLRATGQQLPH